MKKLKKLWRSIFFLTLSLIVVIAMKIYLGQVAEQGATGVEPGPAAAPTSSEAAEVQLNQGGADTSPGSASQDAPSSEAAAGTP